MKLLDGALGVHGQALAVRSRRLELIAQNIANADTPNYKARDLDFRTVLAEAGTQETSMAATRQGHYQDGEVPEAAPAWLAYRHPVQPSIDGNTVELDAEVARYSENALRYQASLTFTSQRIRGLFSAIQGQ